MKKGQELDESLGLPRATQGRGRPRLHIPSPPVTQRDRALHTHPCPRPPSKQRGSPASTGKRQPRTRRTRGHKCACVSGSAQHRPRLVTVRRAPSVGRARDLGSVYRGTKYAVSVGAPSLIGPYPVEKESCSLTVFLR